MFRLTHFPKDFFTFSIGRVLKISSQPIMDDVIKLQLYPGGSLLHTMTNRSYQTKHRSMTKDEAGLLE